MFPVVRARFSTGPEVATTAEVKLPSAVTFLVVEPEEESFAEIRFSEKIMSGENSAHVEGNVLIGEGIEAP